MKTNILYFLIALKTLTGYFILALFFAIAFSSCQSEDFGSFSIPTERPNPGDKAPNPIPTTIPPESIEYLDFPNAEGVVVEWLIQPTEYGDFPNEDHEDWLRYEGLLNIEDWSFYSINSLNMSDAATTAGVDMFLPMGKLRSPTALSPDLTYGDQTHITTFGLSNMTAAELLSMAEHNPEQFEDAYNACIDFGATMPHNEEGEYTYYSDEDVYFFKIHGAEPKYGGIYTHHVPPGINYSPTSIVIKVYVQKENTIGLKNP